ncbi:probable chitinase 10 [Ochlerotatus camptorhynchus]|uniref:probable chitinase 10 n=1 Tax=Ochlerotatus camptorhynchus TaxID=644619 RepID=UPI0031D5C997
MRIWTLGLLLLFCGASTLQAATDKVVCYFGSWATYRIANGKFNIEDINPNLCTHIIYTFVGLDASNSMVKVLDPWGDVTLQGFKRFVGLKSQNPQVKLMIAIGGWGEGSSAYSAMASSAVSRKAFIESVVTLMKTYGFEGFDIDWEYPTLRGGWPEDRVNFVTLLSEMRTRFDKEGYLLSIAVAATKDYHRSAYNVPEINKYVDFLNLMSYDLHAYWDAQTGHNAPLYAARWETDSFTSTLNVDACVRGWLDDGFDASKLIMGVPIHGHTFTLASTADTGVGVRTIGGGTAGPYTLESGTLSYLEICERMKTGYTKRWDDIQKVPYAFLGNQWISFDDVTSIGLKVDYAKSMGLGGVMVWSLESDDDRNVCGEGAYPITSKVYNAVFGSTGPIITTTTTKPVVTTTTTAKPVTTTTTAKPVITTTTKPVITTTTTTKPVATTTPASGALVCKSGFAKDPYDCQYFYQCNPSGAAIVSWRFKCQTGLYFDDKNGYCNWQYLVSYRMFCFYKAGAKYRVGNGRVAITDLNPQLCTHLVYQYVSLMTYGAIETLDLDTTELQQFINLRTNAPSLKVLVSIGGPSQASKTVSSLLSIVSLRKATVTAIVNFAKQYDLDGIDFHWQYPVLWGGNVVDRANFVTFISMLKDELKVTGKLLTISVAPTKDYFLSSYNVPELNKYVDYVNVMAFDLRAYWGARTGHNAAVYPATFETSGIEKELNVDTILKGWITAGLASSKIILGVTTEGHSFKLANPNAHGIQDRTLGSGTKGTYTDENGVLNYLEVCELLKAGGWTTVWDGTQKAHYAYKDNVWVSYESTTSLEAKIYLAKQYQIGGIGVWAAEGDDVRNICGGGPFTLLRFVSEGLEISNEEGVTTPGVTTTTKTTTTTTAKPTTTTTPLPTGLPQICPSSGFVRDPVRYQYGRLIISGSELSDRKLSSNCACRVVTKAPSKDCPLVAVKAWTVSSSSKSTIVAANHRCYQAKPPTYRPGTAIIPGSTSTDCPFVGRPPAGLPPAP